MLPPWLKRSSLGFSVVLAVVTWFLLILVQANAHENSALHDGASAVLMPGFRAGSYVGAYFFPDHNVQGKTGWYVAPLFGIAGEFLLLLAIWYAGIKLKRSLLGEQQTVGLEEYADSHRKKHVSAYFNGEVEPAFTPDESYGRFSYLFHYERFKFGIWQDFREHTGSWPVLSILFHCTAILGIFVSIAAFFITKEKQNWDDWHSFVIGAASAVGYVIFVVVGEKMMRKLDWRLFGKRNS